MDNALALAGVYSYEKLAVSDRSSLRSSVLLCKWLVVICSSSISHNFGLEGPIPTNYSSVFHSNLDVYSDRAKD